MQKTQISSLSLDDLALEPMDDPAASPPSDQAQSAGQKPKIDTRCNGDRRSGLDRRAEIRFEENRRSGFDRRTNNLAWTHGNDL